VLFVGKAHHRKGLDLLLDAFSSVRKDVPAAALHVVGVTDGAISHGEGVFLHGFLDPDSPLDRPRLVELYHRATVFCMPSRYEPFGVVFLEAMLAGIPCIGARAWAMPEIIEEAKTGWLVPVGDVTALAHALREALLNKQNSAEMGKRARERALSKFTWDRVAERALDDLYRLREAGKLGDSDMRISKGLRSDYRIAEDSARA
jgi:glycosyltransferase involved in cell wall biosynthesis